MKAIIAIAVCLAGIVIFIAFQNNVPVKVSVLIWHFESSLAVFLLFALATGAGSILLLVLPTAMKRQWVIANQKRRIGEMERATDIMRKRIAELEPAQGLSQAEVDLEQTGYVGLKQLIAGR